MKKTSLLLTILCLCTISCVREESMEQLTARVFERASIQVKVMDELLDSAALFNSCESIYPRSLSTDGKLVTSDYKWWCSGFFPGTLWLLYEYTGDDSIKDLALKYQMGLEPLRHRTHDHDLGFQLMCSYGNCLRLTNNQDCVPILLDGAKSLASRFDSRVGCTRSWSFGKWSFPVIIDNMMNLELLFKASELGGNEELWEMAVSHADVTKANHFRDNFSCYHLVDYNPETGEVAGKQTVQGYADDSSWARGQAWALYGFPMVYRFTQNEAYLNHAVSVAEHLLSRLPEDGVPYWDYDAPGIPDEVRDASAAAIMASGLIELSTYVDAKTAKRYIAVAEKMLRTLASAEYLAEVGEQCGFILRHSTGNKPADSEVDVPLTYADYYFLEALIRFQSL